MPFSRSRNCLPVLKKGTHFSATETVWPVRGLRPWRASRFLTEKAPKPRNSTRLLRANALEISSKTVLTIRSISRCRRCGYFSARRRIRSDLVIGAPQLVDESIETAKAGRASQAGPKLTLWGERHFQEPGV